MREKSYKRTSVFVALLLACAMFAAGFLLLGSLTSANAEGEASTVATRNENLIVKYDMGNIADGKIKASKWDNGKYVPYTEMDATIHNQVPNKPAGVVEKVDGLEGVGAAKFTGSAHARAKFALPSDATGMTISFRVKNCRAYWSSLVEFWDGTDGGRFGKGTMQGNKGRQNESDAWGGNCPAHAEATDGTKANWDNFVTSVDSTDKGTESGNMMVADTWYQVSITVTATELNMYRDGVLKLTFNNDHSKTFLASIMKAAKNQDNGMLGIRLCLDAADGDILDDFRIYNGAMAQADITAVCNEYKAIASISSKTLKTDDTTYGTREVSLKDGGGVEVLVKDATTFPKLLIGDATAVPDTENSYTGEGYSYTYTVSGDVATVTYTDTASGGVFEFTVTRVVQPDAYYSDLKVSIDGGEAKTLDGFLLSKQNYTLALERDNYSVAFSGTLGDATTMEESNISTVNGSINYNGANTITVAVKGDTTKTYSYTITISRDRADEAMPTVNGIQLGHTQQTIYMDTLPATLTESDIELKYPNGSQIKAGSFSYAPSTHVLTFTVQDKCVKDGVNLCETAYTVTFKTKTDGQLAHWALDETSGTSYAGKIWNETTQAFEVDDTLAMTTHSGTNNEAPFATRPKAAPTSIDGKLGKAIQLADWGFTVAKLPTASTVTGFTFSTWMKTTGIVWEEVFAVYNQDYTKGVLFEKGHMQKPGFSGTEKDWGKYGGDYAPTQAIWKSGLKNNDKDEENYGARASYFNSKTDFVLYTVTVSYIDNVGVVKFYKNGELAATYNNNSVSNEVAQITIGALNNGGYIGLHRHMYDGGQKSSFDDVRMFAYAMTDTEVAALHSAYGDVLNVAATPVEVNDMTSYPAIVLGGDNAESPTGVTTSGVKYSYTAITGAPTKAKDDAGVDVTLEKNGISRVINVTYTRTFDAPTATTLGYKVGAAGTNQALTIVATQNIVVDGSIDLTQTDAITKGDCSVTAATGTQASDYNIAFAYDASTKTATYTVTYSDYTEIKTVYAVTFENRKYTVTYNLNDVNAPGTAPAQATDIAYNTAITAPEEPKWTDHVFKGWYKDTGCSDGQKWDFENDKVTADVTLYAKWVEGYAITYYDGTTPLTFDGKNGYEHGTAFTLPTASKPGYTFEGWYNNEGLTGDVVTTIATTETGAKTYYAKWSVITYTITWDANGGTLTGDASTRIDYDADLTLPTPPTKEGETFLGWFTDVDDPDTQITAGKWTTASNVTAKAKWASTMFTVSFDTKGGNTIEPVQVAGNTKATAPATPVKAGHRFDEWYADEAYTTAWNFDTAITANVTLYAKWVAVCTVTFDLNGGNGSIAAVTVDSGTKIAAPTSAPTRTGYTFDGWYKDLNGTEAWNFGTDAVTAPTILYAKWTASAVTPAVYSVSFNTQGGSAVADVIVNGGEKVAKPVSPARDGYLFDGWYKDAECTTAWNFETDTVTDNTTLYAKWNAFTPSEGSGKSGCGSSVTAETSAIVAVLMLAVAAVVIVLKKKKAF